MKPRVALPPTLSAILPPTLLPTLILTIAGFSSCETIQTAPKGSPRIEVQVVYEVGDDFYAPFAEGIDKKEIQTLLQKSVNPLADIGLRFYAIPADQYREGQKQPDYVMHVRATSCKPNRQIHKKITKVEDESEGKDGDGKKKEPKEITTITAELYGVSCKLSVKLSKRRADAPALVVGEKDASGGSSTFRDDESAAYALQKKGEEENDTAVTGRMLRSAFAEAAKRAFAELQKPIDRELQATTPPKKGGTR